LQKWIFNILLVLPLGLYGQIKITGKVQSAETGIAIEGALIKNNQSNVRVKSDSSGKFTIYVLNLPVEISISANGFERQQQVISSDEFKVFSLETKQRTMNTVVVSAGRRDQKLKKSRSPLTSLSPH